MKACAKCRVTKPLSEFYGRIEATSHCKSCCSTADRRRKTGWSQAAFASQLAKQEGRCAICRHRILAKERGKRQHRACGDHDHDTRKTRGILCVKCNMGIGYFNDNYKLLASASKYLLSWRTSGGAE